jgi:hypothetical protein
MDAVSAYKKMFTSRLIFYIEDIDRYRECFLNYLNPIISAIYGFTGFTIEPLSKEHDATGNSTIENSTIEIEG